MLPTWLESDRSKIITSIVMVFAPIFGYVFQFPFYQNCINLKMMMILYGIIGILIGAGFAYRYAKDLHFLIERVQLSVAFIFAGLILVPLIASLINRAIPTSAGHPAIADIQRIDGYSQSRFGDLGEAFGEEQAIDGVYIYALLEGKPIRLTVDTSYDLEGLEKGDQLQVNICKGLLGLKWVDFDVE